MRYIRAVPIFFALVVVLAACIPQIGGGDIAQLFAERTDTVVTATLELKQGSTDVQVIFLGSTFQEVFTAAELDAGAYTFDVETTETVSCSASGYAGATYWLAYCTAR